MQIANDNKMDRTSLNHQKTSPSRKQYESASLQAPEDGASAGAEHAKHPKMAQSPVLSTPLCKKVPSALAACRAWRCCAALALVLATPSLLGGRPTCLPIFKTRGTIIRCRRRASTAGRRWRAT